MAAREAQLDRRPPARRRAVERRRAGDAAARTWVTRGSANLKFVLARSDSCRVRHATALVRAGVLATGVMLAACTLSPSLVANEDAGTMDTTPGNDGATADEGPATSMTGPDAPDLPNEGDDGASPGERVVWERSITARYTAFDQLGHIALVNGKQVSGVEIDGTFTVLDPETGLELDTVVAPEPTYPISGVGLEAAGPRRIVSAATDPDVPSYLEAMGIASLTDVADDASWFRGFTHDLFWPGLQNIEAFGDDVLAIGAVDDPSAQYRSFSALLSFDTVTGIENWRVEVGASALEPEAVLGFDRSDFGIAEVGQFGSGANATSRFAWREEATGALVAEYVVDDASYDFQDVSVSDDGNVYIHAINTRLGASPQYSLLLAYDATLALRWSAPLSPISIPSQGRGDMVFAERSGRGVCAVGKTAIDQDGMTVHTDVLACYSRDGELVHAEVISPTQRLANVEMLLDGDILVHVALRTTGSNAIARLRIPF